MAFEHLVVSGAPAGGVEAGSAVANRPEQLAHHERDLQRAAPLRDDHARARDAVATVRDPIPSTVAVEAAASKGSGK